MPRVEYPPPARVESIAFAPASDEDNRRSAVVEVTTAQLPYNSNNAPVTGGVYDARMGTADHHYTCLTCGHSRRECPGHPGIIHSQTPLYSPLFIFEIRRWLRVLCLSCGAAVVDPARFANVPAANRLAEASKATTENVACPACGAVHPKIVKDDKDNFSFIAEKAGAPPELLHPEKVRAVFERAPAALVAAFGRPYHPRDLVLREIQVPPVTIRPGARQGFGTADHKKPSHDLSTIVQYMVRRNQTLGAAAGAGGEEAPAPPREVVRNLLNAQQLYYDMVVGSSAAASSAGKGAGRRALVSGNNAPVASITRGFARKQGRLRKNLLGKRVLNISRSTISGNPHLRVDEVAYPQAFARVLQVRERVQPFNRERLMVHFLNGEDRYPGCTRVHKKRGGVYRVAGGGGGGLRLEVGDVLERDVVTGDVGFFNRAPSLEPSSIGVHRLVVLPDPDAHTFQMNVIACDWYNADFDGDQMNLWVPHGVMPCVEAVMMSGVVNRFISAKTSGPVNGQVQDSNVGSFELTREGVAMDRFHAMDLFAASRVPFPDLSAGGPGRRLSGAEVVSLLLEATPVNYRRPPTWFKETLAPYLDYKEGETLTEVKRGRLLRGVLDKASVGAGAGGGLFHLIAREHGAEKALEAIFALQQMALKFVGYRGFTVGTSDMVLRPEDLAGVQEIVAGVRREADAITARLLRGELLPPIGMTTHEYYERLQKEALKAPDELLRPILASVDPDRNGLYKMVATGSKGSTPNLIHIMGLIGQIEINTQRIQEQFGFRRTGVYFPRFATSPEAYGFVSNSYVTGMTAPEFVFSDMNGRFDLINKALSTASTGYANRKAVMALQSDIVDNHRHLAKASKIVQLLYGEDGLDTRRVEPVRFRTVSLSEAALRAEFRLDLAAAGVPGADAAAQRAFDADFAAVLADREEYRRAFLRFEDAAFGETLSDRRLMPVHVARLVRDVKIARDDPARLVLRTSGRGAPAPDAAALLAMRAKVADLCRRLPYLLVNEIQERRGAPHPPHLEAATSLLAALVRAELSGPVLRTLAPAELDFILAAIRRDFSRALIDYGTAAGIVAAQSVSEPLTQYMLDSHHRSVGGGTNKAGIIRPSEIFGAKPVEAEQSSEMLLRVRPEFEGDRAEVLQIANQIELMDLARFVRRWDVLLEPFGAPEYPPFADADRAWLAAFRRYHPLLPPPPDLTNWCLRLTLDRATLILKSMSLETIVERLRAQHPWCYVAHSPENGARVVLRLSFRAAKFQRGRALDEEKVREIVTRELLPTTIRGVPGIRAAAVRELKRHRVGPDGALELATVYAIATEGTNIYGVLLNRRIDPLRVVSSSIGDTERAFGLAAARDTVVREIRRFMGGKAPNPHHLLVYADEMARSGRITSLEKKGVNLRDKDNVLLRMAMSSPAQVLQEAASTGAGGPLYGVAPYMLLGRAPPLGTTWNAFAVDEDYVRANRKSVKALLDEL